MNELLQDISTAGVLAATTYIATNLDNLVVLSGLTVGTNRASVVAGYAIATASLLIALLVSAAFGRLVPIDLLGYLGFVPLLMGVRLLFVSSNPAGSATATGIGTSGVVSIILSNSVDSLAAFTPLFAESELVVVIALAAGFVISAGAFLTFTLRVSSQPIIAQRIARIGPKLAPLIMIAIGIYVLWDSGTDLV